MKSYVGRVSSQISLTLAVASVFAFNFPGATALAQKAVPRSTAESWRKQPPQPAPARPFALPAMRSTRLKNGLTLVMIEDHRTPMVTIDINIPTGSVNDPAGQPGLAEAAAELLTEGAGNRTSEQLSREIETLGGQISSSANDDFSDIEVSVVAENAERMMEIAGDVALRPTFPVNEVALYKDNRIQVLTVQRQDPAYLVSEHFNRILYGAHPYGITSPTPESVAAMDREKIERFYKTSYSPTGSVIVIVGDFEPEKMEAKVRAIFEGWKASDTSELKLPAMPERKERRVYLIDRPGSEQADFRVGNLGVAHRDADYFPLLVANTILGGGTSSRLFLNIREQKGYTYDVSSSINAPLRQGTFFGASETRTEVAVPAIKEMLAEFDRLRAVKVTETDLRNAKNYLSGVFSLILSTEGGVADQIGLTYMLGLGPDYLKDYRARIEAVTADQVQQAARKYVLTDRPAIVVVGDAAKLRKELSTVGPVEVFDIEGKAIK